MILSIDQGTSSTKTIVFDANGQVVARATVPLKSYYLNDGFVEQDAEDIYQNVLSSVKECFIDFTNKGFDINQIQTCGISNQRETFVVWNGKGKPLYNAIVWQCKRSVNICEQLKNKGLNELVKSKTGLIIDPYFSGTKLIWLYENNEMVKNAIDNKDAYFGTVDTWLLFKLTGGNKYFTDYTNASRTLFFNLQTLNWDKELLAAFNLENINLPELKPSSDDFGETDFNNLLSNPISISAMIGDSHAAAFGEGCFTAGTAKATMGTGSSILMNIGREPKTSANGMLTTICWSTENRVDFAFEGAIVSCGATIEWLKNELNLFKESKETEAMANAVDDANGVYLIPAFSGLGAPHWDMNRKASISGITFGTNKNHIVHAALASIPYQINDVIEAMEADGGIVLKELKVNGGLTSNRFVLQMLSDLLGKPVANIGMPDVSALGAALLAGLKTGIFSGIENLNDLYGDKLYIQPAVDSQKVRQNYEGWKALITGNN